MASGERRISTTLAATSTSLNILADSILRYPGRPSVLAVQAASDTASVVFMTVEIGSMIIVDDALIPIEVAAGSGPTRDRQYAISSGVGPGDQISIRFRNSGAGTPVAIAAVKVVPVG